MAKDNFENKIKQTLQNAEVTPPADAWHNIESKLNKEKGGSIWLRWASMAAVILLLVGIGYFALLNENNFESENQIQNKDFVKGNQNSSDNSVESSSYKTNSNQKNIESISVGNNTSGKELTPHSQTKNENNNAYSANVRGGFSSQNDAYAYDTNNYSQVNNSRNNFSSNQNNRTEINTHTWVELNSVSAELFYGLNELTYQRNQETSLNDKLIPLAPELNEKDLKKLAELNESNPKAAKIKEKKLKWENSKKDKFYVNTYISPVFLSSFGTQNLITPSFNNLRSNNPVRSAYGAKVGYRVNDKLHIRSGIGALELQQNTYGAQIDLSAKVESVKALNIDTKSDINLSTFTNNISTDLDNGGKQQSNLDISQEIAYVEVPFEVEYEILESGRVALNITTGLSTLILKENTLYLNNALGTVLGEASNVNPLSFSANTGVKFDVKINPDFSLNVEPQLKYLFNSFDNNKDLAPYVLGVQGGLSYSF